jgi:hypothetical protein
MGGFKLIEVGTLVHMVLFGLKYTVSPKGGMSQARWFCKLAWVKAETLQTHKQIHVSVLCKFMGEMQLLEVGTLVLLVKFWLKCTVAP